MRRSIYWKPGFREENYTLSFLKQVDCTQAIQTCSCVHVNRTTTVASIRVFVGVCLTLNKAKLGVDLILTPGVHSTGVSWVQIQGPGS